MRLPPRCVRKGGGRRGVCEKKMPLVEYDSSSDEDGDDGEVAQDEVPHSAAAPLEKKTVVGTIPTPAPAVRQKFPIPPPDPPHKSSGASLHVRTKTPCVPSGLSPSIELPNAALLLSSPSFSDHNVSTSDHCSRVAAAMAENASRKRASNVMSPKRTQIKHHKGSSPVQKSMADRLLIPPQLQGRSNVVTEDIGKLFVKKRAESY